jgi:hypothetical protein
MSHGRYWAVIFGSPSHPVKAARRQAGLVHPIFAASMRRNALSSAVTRMGPAALARGRSANRWRSVLPSPFKSGAGSPSAWRFASEELLALEAVLRRCPTVPMAGEAIRYWRGAKFRCPCVGAHLRNTIRFADGLAH